MFSVYVLRCGDGGLYIGFTGDVDGRLKRHKAGAVPATRRRLPVELVYREEFGTRVEAMGRERKLKRGWGRQWLRRRLPPGRPARPGA